MATCNNGNAHFLFNIKAGKTLKNIVNYKIGKFHRSTVISYPQYPVKVLNLLYFNMQQLLV